MPGAAANQGTSRLAIRADRAFGGREMFPRRGIGPMC